MADGLNPYAPPEAELDVRGQVGTVVRDGKWVRMDRNGQLPDRCIACNAPALPERIVRTLYWTPWQWQAFAWGLVVALFFAMMASPEIVMLVFWPAVLVLVVANMIIRKRVLLEIGLCARHLGRRRMIFRAALGFTIGVIALSVAIVMGRLHLLGTWLTLAIPLMLLLGVVNGYAPGNATALGRVSKTHLWLKRTGRAFRDSLPDPAP